MRVFVRARALSLSIPFEFNVLCTRFSAVDIMATIATESHFVNATDKQHTRVIDQVS